jgi:hypothetical protein
MTETRSSFFGRILGAKKLIACAVLFAMAPLFLGCYGAFPLTKAIYKANGRIQNTVLRNVVFWVFVIVPVYGIGMLADAVIFNLIDFWFGQTITISSATDEYGNLLVLAPSADGTQAVLTVSHDGQVVTEVSFVRTSDTVCEVRGADGSFRGQALRTPQGGIELTDAKGSLVASISPDDVRQGRSAELALQLAR